MATGFVNGKWQTLTHRISTALKHRQKFVKADYVGDPYTYVDIWAAS